MSTKLEAKISELRSEAFGLRELLQPELDKFIDALYELDRKFMFVRKVSPENNRLTEESLPSMLVAFALSDYNHQCKEAIEAGMADDDMHGPLEIMFKHMIADRIDEVSKLNAYYSS